jgi:hypothetical protein
MMIQLNAKRVFVITHNDSELGGECKIIKEIVLPNHTVIEKP